MMYICYITIDMNDAVALISRKKYQNMQWLTRINEKILKTKPVINLLKT